MGIYSEGSQPPDPNRQLDLDYVLNHIRETVHPNLGLGLGRGSSGKGAAAHTQPVGMWLTLTHVGIQGTENAKQ